MTTTLIFSFNIDLKLRISFSQLLSSLAKVLSSISSSRNQLLTEINFFIANITYTAFESFAAFSNPILSLTKLFLFTIRLYDRLFLAQLIVLFPIEVIDARHPLQIVLDVFIGVFLVSVEQSFVKSI
jgi:hypothetical protein